MEGEKEELTPRSSLTHIGNWRLGPTLGRGAYGHVRLATHITGRKAACKILPALRHDPTQPVTWDQTVDAMEAHKEVVLLKALSGLKMPGVVELEGIVERDGWTYMFSTLHPHSAAHVQEPWEHDQLVTFFRRLCMTVHSLHSLHVSHEDLKRSNVLVDPVGCPSLIDFGFSHFAAYGQRVRSAGGTLDYSSPQKIEDGMYYGAQNDVWSLGIFLAKILHIPHPYIDFNKDNESTAKRKIAEGIPDFQFEPYHMGPGKAASLIVQMLEPDANQRLTIPEILEHPFLTPYRPDPVPFHLPSYELSSKLYYALSPSVIQDICFLAYLNHEFALCQTSKDVVDRLYGSDPCWEKRWAKMLSRWKRREDMDWEDIPRARATARSIRSQVSAAPRRTVLRDIAQTSRVNTSNVATAHDKATLLVSPNAKAKHARENMIPDHDSPPGRLEIFSRVKRHKKPPAALALSLQKGMLPDHQKATQNGTKEQLPHTSPKKGNDHRADHRAHRRALVAAPREHRRHRGASLLSDDSIPQGYPVMNPVAGPSNLITLDEAGPSSRPRDNIRKQPPTGDLLGDSVEVMRALYNAQSVAAPKTPKAPPRRSSRIAEKRVSRGIR